MNRNSPNVQAMPATGKPPGVRNAVGGRFAAEPSTPRGDYYKFTRDFDRTFDVNQGAYWPILAAAPVNAWQRGSVVRSATPILKLTWFGPMYDPTNPAGWEPNL